MNILFITENHSTATYGITTVVSEMLNELVEKDIGIRAMLISTGKEIIVPHKSIVTKLISPSKIGNLWRWSPELFSQIERIIKDQKIELIHIHGVWMAAQWAGLSIAKKTNIPCIVSVHGMLEPWFWKESTFFKRQKKNFYMKFVFSPRISSDTVFHAVTPLEKENLNAKFPQNQVFVIPNAISIRDVVLHQNNPEKYFLFLGRIHPIKGVDLLIQAFHYANLDKEWKLIIAGPNDVPSYVKKIESMIVNLGLSDQVEMIGPVFAAEKWNLIQRAWCMITPSYSEVMGMVNLEAAVYAVPSITTYETGLYNWQNGGGILVHPSAEELKENLISASEWSLKERLIRGKKSRLLVEQIYSVDAIIPQWIQLYTSLIKRKVNQ